MTNKRLRSKKIQTEDGIKWVAEYQYVSPSFENM